METPHLYRFRIYRINFATRKEPVYPSSTLHEKSPRKKYKVHRKDLIQYNGKRKYENKMKMYENNNGVWKEKEKSEH